MVSTMEFLSNAVRSTIVAAPQHKLLVADLSNIEGRTLAWLGGETWKLDAFRAYDAGTGPDLYKLAYARAFAVLVESVTKDQRQIGKVMELALGYQGGVGAFITFAAAYGIDLEALAGTAWPLLPEDLRREAADFWDWTLREKRPTFGLSREAFMVCDAFKRGWRRIHPGVSSLWPGLEDACKTAVQNPGQTFTAGPLRTRRDGAWLRVALPSGRSLCYPQPEIDDKGRLSYMGNNQYTRQWSRIPTYGGKLVENVTQATARDVMAHGMVLADRYGLPIVLTVHDEILAEVPDSPLWPVQTLIDCMAAVPAFAPGLPLAAAGFETTRYRKE